MGASLPKVKQERHDPPTLKRDDDGSIEEFREEARPNSSQEDDDGSFVFISREWSCSISSAEDAVLLINNITNEASPQPQNVDAIQISEDAQQTKANCENVIPIDSPETKVNPKQDLNKVESGSRKKSDTIDIMPNSCSGAEEFSIHLISDSGVQNSASCLDNFSPPGKEEWLQINNRLNGSLSDSKMKLFYLYEVLSNYGSISALATTKDHIYIKFSSWAGIVNVLDDIKNLRQLYQFTSLVKVEDDTVKSHPDRTEIYLDLPSLVVSYLKDHIELSRAMVIITMTANDNICLNAPKIQHVLDHLKKNVSRGFQYCTFYPFGCHVLGSWDRTEILEIFVDTGDMYAGCHKQSDAEQTAISKEVRKLISHDITYTNLEESPICAFYHNTVGLKCILYFNNGFGDRCTRLLGVFMDYDPRFRVLYFVLDAWSRQCSLQGVSNGFTSYIVAVLLVFYLQMLPIPLLPPLHRIRASRPVFIKGWDCSFIEDPNMMPKNECTTEIHSLLRGFFVFYGNYDWDRVVCPVLGQSIDREILSRPPAPFPDDPIVANYFRAILEQVPNTPQFDTSTSMCVQDFFNLSENIAKCVSSENLFRFQSLCRQSHKMIYCAESKLPCGPHSLLHSSEFVPFHERNVRLDGPPGPPGPPSHLNPCTKFGPFDNYSAPSRNWERTSRPVLANENNHGVYSLRERSFPRSYVRGDGRGQGPKNNTQNRAKTTSSLVNNNNEERKTNQLNSRDSLQGRKTEEGNSSSRSYRGRVFWHNRHKNAGHVG